MPLAFGPFSAGPASGGSLLPTTVAGRLPSVDGQAEPATWKGFMNAAPLSPTVGELLRLPAPATVSGPSRFGSSDWIEMIPAAGSISIVRGCACR
jgi:hypothetical protein